MKGLCAVAIARLLVLIFSYLSAFRLALLFFFYFGNLPFLFLFLLLCCTLSLFVGILSCLSLFSFYLCDMPPFCKNGLPVFICTYLFPFSFFRCRIFLFCDCVSFCRNHQFWFVFVLSFLLPFVRFPCDCILLWHVLPVLSPFALLRFGLSVFLALYRRVASFYLFILAYIAIVFVCSCLPFVWFPLFGFVLARSDISLCFFGLFLFVRIRAFAVPRLLKSTF